MVGRFGKVVDLIIGGSNYVLEPTTGVAPVPGVPRIARKGKGLTGLLSG